MRSRASPRWRYRRDLGLAYKSAFVLCHKLREAMAEEMKGRIIGGEGKVAEVDGGYFGGYVKPANLRENRIDRRLAQNQTGKRKVVVIVRERGGNSVPAVFQHGRRRPCHGSSRASPREPVVNADEAPSWDELARPFRNEAASITKRLIQLDGACTNWAEEYFSRLRRAEIGHHHHIAGPYLLRYAQEASWREDNRRVQTAIRCARLPALRA